MFKSDYINIYVLKIRELQILQPTFIPGIPSVINHSLTSVNCPNVYFLFVLQGDVKMHFKKSAMNWPQHFLYLL